MLALHSLDARARRSEWYVKARARWPGRRGGGADALHVLSMRDDHRLSTALCHVDMLLLHALDLLRDAAPVLSSEVRLLLCADTRVLRLRDAALREPNLVDARADLLRDDAYALLMPYVRLLAVQARAPTARLGYGRRQRGRGTGTAAPRRRGSGPRAAAPGHPGRVSHGLTVPLGLSQATR